MESQQIVDYIRDQLAAGFDEKTLRNHLVTHGWSVAATDDAFRRYHATSATAPVTPQVMAARKKRRGIDLPFLYWSFKDWVRAVAVVAVVAGAGVGAHAYLQQRHVQKAAVRVLPKYSFRQRQSIDVNSIGGAVSLFAQANDALPTGLSTASDGNLVLCGTSCDPRNYEVTSLLVYKPANVKLAAYIPGLSVSDPQTMYLVPGAKCTNEGTLGDASTAPRAMVILYAQDDSGAPVKQRCVTL